MEKIFTNIYNNNSWGNSESVSGPSSTMERTEHLRMIFPSLLSAYNIKKVFDAPCGDLNWMKEIIVNSGITYIGGDIVLPLIVKHSLEYSYNNKTSFIHIDLTEQAFPESDLMISRDFLFHLSYADTKEFLKNFSESNINFLLTTTHIPNLNFANKDIVTGGWRWMDLFAPPYNFSKNPLLKILDGGGDRYMCLWTRSQIVDIYNRFVF